MTSNNFGPSRPSSTTNVSALLERLTGSRRQEEVAAVIVESGLETVYLMEGRFGRGNLARSATWVA